MIYTTQILSTKLKSYKDPLGKIMRMLNSGELFSITKGIYEDNKNTPGYYLSEIVYGPSYLSFDFALSWYNLIPEAVYVYTCATFNKKKKKDYVNCFGHYIYRDVPKAVFPYGVRLVEENGYAYKIATPEKALCDKLYTISPVHSVKDIRALLFEDLRIDEEEFKKLNFDDLKILCDLYHSNNMKYLKKMVEKDNG